MIPLLVTVLLVQTQATKLSDEDVKGAVALWKEFSMPIPPPTVVPILLNNNYPGRQSIALMDRRAGEPDIYYQGGSTQKQDKYDKLEVLSWDYRFKQSTEVPSRIHGFNEDPNISAAIQSQIIGHAGFAASLFESPGPENRFSGLDASWLGEPKDKSLKARCALLIATRLANDFCKPHSDGQAILERLIKLDKYDLVVRSHVWPFGTLKNLITGVKETTVPSNAPPGSPQEAVDNLTEIASGVAKRTGRWTYPEDTEEYKKVLSFGLDAVLPLANELDKHRLTRLFKPRIDDGPPTIYQTESIARGILAVIAKGELAQFDRKTVLEWYEAKKLNRVADWQMRNLTRSYTDSYGQFHLLSNYGALNAIYYSNHDLLKGAVAKLKHMPVSIPAEYEYLWPLPSDTNDVREVHGILVKLQYEKPFAPFDRLLVKFLRKSPKEFDESYAGLPPFAFETENSEVWKRLDDALKRADTTMRICLLSRFLKENGVYEPAFVTKTILPILRRYFDDASKVTNFSQKEALSHFAIFPSPDTPSVGRIALHRAAVICGVLRWDDKDLSENDWTHVRKKIDARDYRPLRHHKDY